jgi:hypothetical protein
MCLVDANPVAAPAPSAFVGRCCASGWYAGSDRSSPAQLSAANRQASIEKEGLMASSSKRQQTMAKRNREQAVREKRELKLAKKHAAAIARNAPPEEIELTGPLARTDLSEAPADTDLPARPAEGVIDDISGS